MVKRWVEQKSIMRNLLITIYVLVVLALSATAKADFRIQPIYPKENLEIRVFKGELAQADDGRFFLAGFNGRDYELNVDADLSGLVGQIVLVRGVEIKKSKGNPALTTESTIPLQDSFSFKRDYPVIVVLDVDKFSDSAMNQ